MSATTMVALGLALLFAVFTGFNDAGVLVGVGLGVRGMRPAAALCLLTVAVLGAPVVLGTAVASTLDGRLVPSDGGTSRPHVLAGIAAAVAVTMLLAGRALPTSLTLALIGGIAGAGVGGGLARGDGVGVDWAVLASVLAAAAAAPVGGVLAALATGRLLAAWPPAEGSRGRDRGGVAVRLRWLHVSGFAATCLAYGANDGQKMLAVYAVVLGGVPDRYARSPLVAALIAAGFVAGGLAGLRRIGAAGGGLAVTRGDGVVTTELSSAAVVLGAAAVGAPVSMTQSMSGALVGTALRGGARRVRWAQVLRLGRAWVLTLPAAFLTGGAGAAAVSALS